MVAPTMALTPIPTTVLITARDITAVRSMVDITPATVALIGGTTIGIIAPDITVIVPTIGAAVIGTVPCIALVTEAGGTDEMIAHVARSPAVRSALHPTATEIMAAVGMSVGTMSGSEFMTVSIGRAAEARP